MKIRYYQLFLVFVLVLVIALWGSSIPHQEPFSGNPEKDTVCLYAYYEKNEDYKHNLEFFLQNGIESNVDYYIIINGDSTVQIPQDKPNIKVIQRENKGFDFGAWSNGLRNLTRDYTYYAFLNSSVIGPYMTKEDKDQGRNWVQKFQELFKTGPDVKLVGSTINMVPDWRDNKPLSHVQSMFFMMNKEALDFLNSKDFFNEEQLNQIKSIQEIIDQKEIGMSQMILKNNWNINCIVPVYRDQDYRKLDKNLNKPEAITDVVYKYAFFGRTLTPEEVVFYKKYRFDLSYCTVYN
jgi:Rhamnan synthesis protein F